MTVSYDWSTSPKYVIVKALTTSETQPNSSVKTGKPLVSTFELIMLE